ncbi:MAG TPA: HEAT repeat domain-containing protein, partial [Herpetosiphonaceae bacterium]|nr:HEAT repeat domain-containing protein [Herpetosiphonaceae bacterium]
PTSGSAPVAGRAPDGDQVAAAARGLGWMGERTARPVIEAVARDHASILVRIAARVALGDLADPDSLPMLLELLAPSVPSPSNRSEWDVYPVLTSLVRCAPPSEQAAVVRAVFAQSGKKQSFGNMSFGSGSASFDFNCSTALRGIADPAAWQECVAVLGDAQRTMDARSMACGALGAASDRPEIREALLAVVGEKNSTIAGAAARALAVHADAALAERLIQRLAAAPAGSSDVFLLGRALGHTRMASAAEALLRFAPQDRVWARVALEAAVDTGQPFVPARVRAMLEPRWPTHLRAEAARHAVDEDPRANARLIESLLADEAPEVRAAAVTRLEEPSPHLDRIAALRRALEDASGTVRVAAVETMNQADLTPAALAQAILPLARDPDAKVRAKVASLLPLTLDDDAVWKAAEELGLRDRDRFVRMRCLERLGLALDRESPRIVQAIELLSRMRADPEEDTRRNAQQRLEQVGSYHPLAARLAKEAVGPQGAVPSHAADPKPAADF